MALMAAIGMGFGLTATGAVVDMYRTQNAKQLIQDALDSAALLKAQTAASADSTDRAKELFASNVQIVKAQNMRSTYAVQDSEVAATATVDIPLIFGSLLNRPITTVSVRSHVALGAQNQAGPCMIALTERHSPGLLLNGGAELDMPDCEVHIHSEGNPALTVNAGITLDAKRTCVSGDRLLNNGGARSGIEMSCDAMPDPYADEIPVPDSDSCDYSHGNFDQARIVMRPGTYCGWFNFNNSDSEIEFKPGLYVLKNGGWNVNGGTWEGEGVTFYYSDTSKIQFNSAVKAEFTPPDSGPYEGIFMAEAEGLSSTQFILNDSRGFDFEGVVHLPSREVVLNGGATVRSRSMMLIADRFIVNTAKLKIEPVNLTTSASAQDIYIKR
jgi:hypothetical protein